MLQPIYKYFKKNADSNHISPAVSNNSLAPALNHHNTKLRIKFDGDFLKQDKATLSYKQVVNVYIVYEINLGSHIQGH